MATQLVHLAEVERLSPHCVRLLGANPGKFTLQGTNTYLLGNGPSRILVDTGQGMPGWITNLKTLLKNENATIVVALITHWHADHQGGVSHLLELFPSAKVYKNSPEHGQQQIFDGQIFSAEGVTLQAFHTPGHTKDHIVFHLKEEDAIFSGDNVLGQGTAVFEDLSTYLKSLERMLSIFKGRIYPGHGPVLTDGPMKISEYISHRQQREDQVIQALKSTNFQDIMGLVRIIYADVSEELYKAAGGGVAQILQKLEREGKVVEEDGKWRLQKRSIL